MSVLSEKRPSKRKPEMVFRERTEVVSRNDNFQIGNADLMLEKATIKITLHRNYEHELR